jgi:hypothetical protein
MAYHLLEKIFTDYADNIEGVNIHYALTTLGATPDWENQRLTRFMPVSSDGVRRKVLRLPLSINDAQDDEPVSTYLLHYYFEIFQDGDRHYSQPYVEEIETGARPITERRGSARADTGEPSMMA